MESTWVVDEHRAVAPRFGGQARIADLIGERLRADGIGIGVPAISDAHHSNCIGGVRALLTNTSELWDSTSIAKEDAGNALCVWQAEEIGRDHLRPFVAKNCASFDNEIATSVE